MMQKPSIENIQAVVTMMDGKLKAFHESGRVLRTVSFDTVQLGEEGVFFSEPVSSSLVDDFEYAKKKNIKDFAYTSMGMYVCAELSEYQQVEPYYFDYAKISQNDASFVLNNYRSIRGSIPYNPEYFDDIVLNDNISYYSDYVKNIKNSSSNSSERGNVLVKATAWGKAMTDKNDDGYVKAWFYLIMLGCFCIFTFVAYILYTSL